MSIFVLLQLVASPLVAEPPLVLPVLVASPVVAVWLVEVPTMTLLLFELPPLPPVLTVALVLFPLQVVTGGGLTIEVTVILPLTKTTELVLNKACTGSANST
ncbi:hypothetical protein BH10PAT3_BH10PAT3_0430 [soil metagenome]